MNKCNRRIRKWIAMYYTNLLGFQCFFLIHFTKPDTVLIQKKGTDICRYFGTLDTYCAKSSLNLNIVSGSYRAVLWKNAQLMPLHTFTHIRYSSTYTILLILFTSLMRVVTGMVVLTACKLNTLWSLYGNT